MGADIFLKVQSTSQKENKTVEVKMGLPGNDIVAKKNSKTFEDAISQAADSLRKQLVKRKEKLKA